MAAPAAARLLARLLKVRTPIRVRAKKGSNELHAEPKASLCPPSCNRMAGWISSAERPKAQSRSRKRCISGPLRSRLRQDTPDSWPFQIVKTNSPVADRYSWRRPVRMLLIGPSLHALETDVGSLV